MRSPAILLPSLLVLIVIIISGTGGTLRGQTAAADRKGSSMTRANGAFDVKLKPQEVWDKDAGLARLSIDKQFHGDLEGTSKGEMLAAGTAVKDSAGYVAMERVTGTLHGRKGSFALQHNGIANRGVNTLTVTVVPDSGTEDLVGLAGAMKIIITPDGKHLYEFDYTLGK
ncbi:MAG TPA: DUF3224 domain-containing protein [Vicinamibacterales bacterium]|nr:DUF3224 domain-containing protein [Vicinamibacterales bacterium]